MIKVVTRIPFWPAAKILTLFHFAFGAVGAAIGFAAFQLQDTLEPYSGLWPIIAPIYATGGLAITLIATLLYNLIAKLFGGIQIEYDAQPSNRTQRTSD